VKRQFHRGWLRLLILLALSPWSLALLLGVVKSSSSSTVLVLPTRVVIPSLMPSQTFLPPSRTPMPTITQTAVPTSTLTATATLTAMPTPTLATRVLDISAVMPGVALLPSLTPLPSGMIVLPEPPPPLEPLAEATRNTPPFVGWYNFESDYPTVRYSPPWTARQVAEASQGQYHRTEDTAGVAVFPFEGEALRVRYVAARNMGTFAVVVDDMVVDTIDAYQTQLSFPLSRVYTFPRGSHILELRHTGSKNPASEGYAIALDALHVYLGDAQTLILPPAIEVLPTNTPQAALSVQLIAAPSTVQPTGTPEPPSEVAASLIIAYDENGNGAVDPAEGVQGISVRLVEVGTNRVLAHTFTDTAGYARLSIVTEVEVRVVVPYFGQSWTVAVGRNAEAQFTLLLTPGNQPGFIP
jgi:hypothetical protein